MELISRGEIARSVRQGSLGPGLDQRGNKTRMKHLAKDSVFQSYYVHEIFELCF